MSLRKRLLFAFTLFVAIYRSEASEVNDKFTEFEVVPDILDTLPDDLKSLNITYETGLKVSLGNELKPSEVEKAPTVGWNLIDGGYYALLMTDPDAPSRVNATRREIRHWLVVNIVANNLTSGEEVVSYRGSGPPEGTGLHRYIFLLFKQNSTIALDTANLPNSETDRALTSTRNLMGNFTLTLVGGDLFQAQYEGNAGMISTNISLIFGLVLAQILYTFYEK
ncbi:CLUMA_CG004377, isoform A [Clunio marinus]|uniref:CLUMA_CG004377, isoform A n=1 Tax=Clunio marinus TaxID=568069 RepID=A0A1J1HTG7_9DIPT|nr:CLUMA_CG004377, isoform A [Clunio marinus]